MRGRTRLTRHCRGFPAIVSQRNASPREARAEDTLVSATALFRHEKCASLAGGCVSPLAVQFLGRLASQR